MDDPCLNHSLADLRDMARGKIPGFSKMKKKELCVALDKAKLLPREGIQGQVKVTQGFRGVAPPEWDFDKMNQIPAFLLPYDYLYGAGSSVNEVTRYFILPDNYPLIGIQLPNKGGTIPRQEFEISVKDYLNQLDALEANPNTPKTYLINNQEVNLDIIHIKGLTKGARGGLGIAVNQISPRVGSPAWFNLLFSLQIVGMEGVNTKDAELRREYQIITTPTIFDLAAIN